MQDNILNAARWRLHHYYQLYLKLQWEIRRLFDFSKKQPIDAISIVVIGRNDNYGGDFGKRLQTILDWNMQHLPSPELIYVEWNQITANPSDCDWIAQRYPNSKCYIVPNGIHKKIATYPEKMPVMEYFAKNLGIRKTTKDWILIVNADVYLDPNDFRKKMALSPRYVYGTYWRNVKWDGAPIDRSNFNKNIMFVGYPRKRMESVVGNFILTHKSNWIRAQGYDENLTDVRSGVDNDGLYQLLSLGLKPMILGHHYHLDHPETMSKSANPTHGNTSRLKNRKYPYQNKSDWGFVNYSEIEIKKSIWELQEI